MRDFLIGLLGLCALVGCGPAIDCGWVEFEDFDASPAPAGKCAKIVVGAEARITKAPADGCSVDDAPQTCVILDSGESAAAFLPANGDRVLPGGRVPGTRQHGVLNEDGSCPLSCE